MTSNSPAAERPKRHRGVSLWLVGIEDGSASSQVEESNRTLPRAIRNLDAFQSQLASTREAAAKSDARDLHNQLQQYLTFKRRFLVAQMGADGDLDPNLDQIDATMDFAKLSEKVVEYTLARHLGAPNAQDLFHDALSRYVERKSDYDLILGELIPGELSQAGERQLAQCRFNENTNATAADDVQVSLDRLERCWDQPRGKPGISTGIEELDQTLGGGLTGLNVLGGLAGSGKSSLVMQMMLGALADPDVAALVLTLEPSMDKDEWIKRLICHQAGIERAMLESRPDSVVRRRIGESAEQVRAETLGRVRIIDSAALNREMLIDVLADKSHELLNATGASRLFVVADYFQLLPLPMEHSPEDSDRCRVALLESMQRLGRTSRNPTGATILAISEVRKPDSRRPELSMQDLLGSTRLNYAATSVLLLQTPEGRRGHGDDVPRILKVDKARGGATCPVKIPLVFRHKSYRFFLAKDQKATARVPTSGLNPLAGHKGRKPR
jgi:replicative DNA helicase